MNLKEIEAIERWYEGESYMPEVMDNFKELIRLAKLGLWAEEFGIPFLRDFVNNDPNGKADWALSELPK